jgi:hypothetical protein
MSQPSLIPPDYFHDRLLDAYAEGTRSAGTQFIFNIIAGFCLVLTLDDRYRGGVDFLSFVHVGHDEQGPIGEVLLPVFCATCSFTMLTIRQSLFLRGKLQPELGQAYSGNLASELYRFQTPSLFMAIQNSGRQTKHMRRLAVLMCVLAYSALPIASMLTAYSISQRMPSTVIACLLAILLLGRAWYDLGVVMNYEQHFRSNAQSPPAIMPSTWYGRLFPILLFLIWASLSVCYLFTDSHGGNH